MEVGLLNLAFGRSDLAHQRDACAENGCALELSFHAIRIADLDTGFIVIKQYRER